MITLITGGARSGKSSFAEKMAYTRGGSEVIYLATAEVKDEEMAARVRQHQTDRPSEWETVEEPRQISRVLSHFSCHSVVLLDCLTVLVSNLLLTEEGDSSGIKEITNSTEAAAAREEKILEEMKAIVNTTSERKLDLIIVTNEVGLGVIPDNRLGRLFRDISGRMNQFLAKKADEVFLTIAGLPVEIKEIGERNLERFQKRGEN